MTMLANILTPIALGLATLASAIAVTAVWALGELERMTAKENDDG